MREAAFIRRNKDKWQQLEAALDGAEQRSADETSNLYVELTDDLSFARTFYPGSKVVAYLDTLSARSHQLIYKNKKLDRGRFGRFWRVDFPLMMAVTRKDLLLSFVIFMVSVAIGVVSAMYDEDFVRFFMGDGYVNMTLENIENGTPMAVYDHMGMFEMFWMIFFNNMRVGLFIFALGMLLVVGTPLSLMFNGIMVGCFQYFFHKHDLLLESALSIWMHGTLEMSTFVVCGAAGFSLMRGFYFPKTLPRGQSIRLGALRGIKILAGVMPFIFLAAMIESVLTRFAPVMPIWLSATLVLSSLAFVVWYYILVPIQVEKKYAAVRVH